MAWVPVSAWLAALVIALVVLGFCAHELRWKLRRLRGDVVSLQEVAGRLTGLHDQLASTGQRFVSGRPR